MNRQWWADVLSAALASFVIALGFDLIYEPPRWAGGMLFFILFNIFILRAAVENK